MVQKENWLWHAAIGLIWFKKLNFNGFLVPNLKSKAPQHNLSRTEASGSTQKTFVHIVKGINWRKHQAMKTHFNTCP